MKNNLFLQYRSLLKPRPLWIETALYGGYEYIELTDGVWVNRIDEFLVHYALAGQNNQMKQAALEELKQQTKWFTPTDMQQSDFVKLCILINKQIEVCINSYSYTFEQLSYRFNHTKFYTLGNYTTPNFIQVSEEELCRRSSTTLTLVDEASFELKGKLRNWANVLPYNASFFVDSLADYNLIEGGN